MSKLQDEDTRIETIKYVWIEQYKAYIGLGMPPKSEETEREKMRCMRLLLDMYLKYGSKIWPKEENKNT